MPNQSTSDLISFEKRLEKRFEKIDEQFDRITKVVIKGFDRIDKALEEKASSDDMQRVLGLLDAMAKRQEISDNERLVMGHQL